MAGNGTAVSGLAVSGGLFLAGTDGLAVLANASSNNGTQNLILFWVAVAEIGEMKKLAELNPTPKNSLTHTLPSEVKFWDNMADCQKT